MEIKNAVYSIKFDGDILQYKCRSSLRLLLKLLGYQDRIEMPLNILLYYSSRSFFFFRVVRLCVNQYSLNQKDIKPRVLNSILLLNLHSKDNGTLIKIMNQMVQSNQSGQPNLALAHIGTEKIQRFYSQVSLRNSKVEKASGTRKKVVHDISQVQSYSQAG